MANPFFPPAEPVLLPIKGDDATFPVRRIFCVGRNYEAHAKEMGAEVDREAPFYFTKSAHAVCQSGTNVSFPPGTDNLHHEMELVLAIGASAFEVDAETARTAIFAAGCGLDMTRRDLQNRAKEGRKPWDTGKDFENSAVLGPLTPIETFGEFGDQRIWLSVNGDMRQDATLAELVWSPVEIIMHLSTLYHLQPGDLIMTGTPAGVGPVHAGDKLLGGIDRLEPVSHEYHA